MTNSFPLLKMKGKGWSDGSAVKSTAVLLGDLSSVPSTHVGQLTDVCNLSSVRSNVFFFPLRAYTRHIHRDISK